MRAGEPGGQQEQYARSQDWSSLVERWVPSQQDAGAAAAAGVRSVQLTIMEAPAEWALPVRVERWVLRGWHQLLLACLSADQNPSS